ncbi:3,4-dihydroxy-2-butanone-4-phosphate synthase [Parasphingopyxis algicola]|uniref:3,4-dihydroxy-2-butanone-4-phosphate synthase n=1 Tax=Parasphingopyxis algicola TaxID=2026624 RepID=UPI0015A113FE|nr:3,4-dihydroxy-2-butanone-4-phosphate synthase [Parasphingopyxis algicola]QLC26502.1 3,4-dihydroxy-2-butanone-4-phosphate synthase [Parasphingopyxis algicola]
MIRQHYRERGISLSILVDPDTLAGRGRGIFFESALNSDANSINVMATMGRGVVSAALSASRAYALGLQPLKHAVERDHMPMYVTSVEAAACTETGISAAERALTIRTLGDPHCDTEDIVTPGHIMPAIVPETISGNPNLSTFAFDYAHRYAGSEAIAWCDILDEEGETASSEECIALAKRLFVPALVRRGDAAIDIRYLEGIGTRPELQIDSDGLAMGQFA